MNYLAHLYLAEDSPESIIGNLLGDFVKGTAIDHYSDGIKKGISIHRKIDAFTDSHPDFIKSKRLISTINKRYSGIIVDIFYDHFLAAKWLEYSSISLKDFTSNVYQLLEENEEILSGSLRAFLPRLKNENLLMSYASIQGTSTALKRVSFRLKRENSLEKAVEDLKAQYQEFEFNFIKFFPELIKYTKTLS